MSNDPKLTSRKGDDSENRGNSENRGPADFTCAYCGEDFDRLKDSIYHQCRKAFDRCACGYPKGVCWRCAPVE